MSEAEIRVDERARCLQGLEIYAQQYVEKWAPIVGADMAKADAWNILVAARRVCGSQAHQL